MCHQHCGPGQVSLMLGQLDLNSAPEHIDAIGHGQWRQILIMHASRRSSGNCARATRVCFSDTTLVYAHGNVLGAKFAYELQVYAVGKLFSWIPSGRCIKREQLEIVGEADRMGVANIGSQRRKSLPAARAEPLWTRVAGRDGARFGRGGIGKMAEGSP